MANLVMYGGDDKNASQFYVHWYRYTSVLMIDVNIKRKP